MSIRSGGRPRGERPPPRYEPDAYATESIPRFSEPYPRSRNGRGRGGGSGIPGFIKFLLFALILGVAELLIGPDVFASALGHPTVTTDYLALAWFSSSFATVAGGLGAGLESREVVREAAYTSSVGDERALAGPGAGLSWEEDR